MLLNNQQIIEEIKNKSKYAKKQMKMKTQQPKTYGQKSEQYFSKEDTQNG